MKDLDSEIDRAVRSMLDAEPSSAFRARVIDALEKHGGRRPSFSFAIAAGAAAAVVLALIVLLPLRSAKPPVTVVVDARDVHLPAPVTHVAPPQPVPGVRPLTVSTTRRAQRKSLATAMTHESETTGIVALETPVPLSVATLPAPAASTMPSIQPAPLRVTALDLPALEMPREAARGEDR